MKNIVIAFASQKGGVGKSTLSRAFAVGASKEGLKVKIADLDTQQGTCTEWHKQRLNNDFDSVGSVEMFGKSEKAISEAQNYDFLVIDSPARASKGTLEIANQSDLVIIPSGASRDDLLPAIKLCFELQDSGVPSSRVFVVLTRISTDSEASDAQAYIRECGLQVLDHYLPEKAGYKQAQNLGLSILETRYKSLNEKAEALINSIVNNI